MKQILYLAIISTLNVDCSGLKIASKSNVLEIEQKKYNNWDEIFKKAQRIEVETLLTGYVAGERSKALNRNNPNIGKITKNKEPVPVKAFLIKHPSHGDILIDAGFDNSFQSKKNGNLSLMSILYMKLNKLENLQKKGQSLNSDIQNLDLNPEIILFTHIHHDHTSGLDALDNNIMIIMDKYERKGVPKLLVSRHFKGKKNIKYLNFDNSMNIDPFDEVLDIFGDCSILAISTRGHTAGHVSYLINDVTQPLLIVGDAIMNYEAFLYGVESQAIGRKAKQMTKESHQNISDFLTQYPGVKIVYSHD